MLPNAIRSGASSNQDIARLLDESSITFERIGEGKSGVLNFNLRDPNTTCRIEYWADDPNGTPPTASPLSVDCPKDALNLTQKLTIPGLTPGMSVSFRIYVWPKTLTYLTNFSTLFRENRDLSHIQTSHIVVVRFSGPRNSDEIYTYQFDKKTALPDIKASLKQNTATEVSCEESEETLPFPRNASAEDATKRPLHGLAAVSSDGFGRGVAQVHPYFNTRLLQAFEGISRQEDWKWNFDWEGKSFSFLSFPPGYLASLSIANGDIGIPLKNRSLNNALQTIEVGAKSPQLTPSILYPTEIARFVLSIKSEDASRTLLRCKFPIDQATVQIPEAAYNKLGVGTYLAVFTLETTNIHYKEQGDYPPWLITSQDWVHFKLNKRL